MKTSIGVISNVGNCSVPTLTLPDSKYEVHRYGGGQSTADPQIKFEQSVNDLARVSNVLITEASSSAAEDLLFNGQSTLLSGMFRANQYVCIANRSRFATKCNYNHLNWRISNFFRKTSCYYFSN